jgi:hypothetical protein
MRAPRVRARHTSRRLCAQAALCDAALPRAVQARASRRARASARGVERRVVRWAASVRARRARSALRWARQDRFRGTSVKGCVRDNSVRSPGPERIDQGTDRLRRCDRLQGVSTLLSRAQAANIVCEHPCSASGSMPLSNRALPKQHSGRCQRLPARGAAQAHVNHGGNRGWLWARRGCGRGCCSRGAERQGASRALGAGSTRRSLSDGETDKSQGLRALAGGPRKLATAVRPCSGGPPPTRRCRCRPSAASHRRPPAAWAWRSRPSTTMT